MSKFDQFLIGLSARYISLFSFLDDNFSECQWIFNKLCICNALVLWRSALRLLMGKSSILTELSAYITPVFYFQDNNV